MKNHTKERRNEEDVYGSIDGRAYGKRVNGVCFSSPEPQTSAGQQARSQTEQKKETQFEKFKRLYQADREILVVDIDGKTTIESIEAAFQPQDIAGIGEITEEKLSEPGKPYYFKLRALYKGYNKNTEQAMLQDLGDVKPASQLENALSAAFGIDSNVYSVIVPNAVVATLPTEANSIATFYLIAVKITDGSTETTSIIRFVRNIEKPAFDPSKFIVVNGMHYITVNEANAITQQESAMMSMLGMGSMNNSSSVFDPVVYPLVDLMAARVAMDKKNYMNDNTFPTVKVKYVSEVTFKGQSGTTITVSTTDNVLTERMNFSGRATVLKAGEKIRVYYTIAKDPLEIWEVQAIQQL